MVVLIGGVSHTGKTYLAQQLLERHKIPYLSLDHLKMGLIRGAINCGFTADDDDATISTSMWPVVEGIIRTNIENRQHIIIEGCYLPPFAVKSLKGEYPQQIIECYLGFSENYVRKNFEKLILPHRNVVEHRKYPENRSASDFIEEHLRLKELCEVSRLNYFEVDKEHTHTMEEVLNFLNKKIASNLS